MRKFNIFCMMVVSLLLFCSTCVMASENSAVFVVGDEGIYYTGTLVTVPVYLTNNSGFTSVCLEVAFDDDKMELLSVDDFGLLPGANYSTDFSSPYYLRWENSDLDKDIKAEGLVCNLIFYVYEEATGLEFPIILGGLEPEARSAIRSDGSVFECECVDGAIVINILPHEHTYGDWFKGDDYDHLRACDICGVGEYQEHKWHELERYPATQEKEGYVIYECEVCKDDKTEILSILKPDTNKPSFNWFPIINQIQNNKPEPEKENDTTTSPEPDTYTCPYKDISGHWAEDIIKFIDELGLIDGITATQFQPNEPMTREMFVIAMARLAGVESDYVSWAINNGILLGYGNGEYGLTDTVTREQMAVFFLRFFEKMGIDTAELRVKDAYTFADDESISDWAAGAVYEIQMIGLIQGKENNLFDPQGTATRAEAATVLYNLIQTIMNNN